MSIGIGAKAIKMLEDEKTVIYQYFGYDLNPPRYQSRNDSYDGLIMIRKSCFIEPIVREKRRKMPSGRKKTVMKRIRQHVDYTQFIADGSIQIENCSNCWRTDEEKGYDVMAGRILNKIFDAYQDECVIPENISFFA